MSLFTVSNPVHLVLLTDQSVGSTMLCNRFINTLIKCNFNKDKPANRCFISVIGYGFEVKELCSGFLEDLYNNPMRVENKSQKVSDGNGSLVDVAINQLIWVESINNTCTEGENLRHCLLDSIPLIKNLIFARKEMMSIVLDAGCSFAKENIEAKRLFPSSIAFGLAFDSDADICGNRSYHSVPPQYDLYNCFGLSENGIWTIRGFMSFVDRVRHDESFLTLYNLLDKKPKCELYK